MGLSGKPASGNFGQKLVAKVAAVFIRLADVFRLAPRRIVRLVAHFYQGLVRLAGRKEGFRRNQGYWWWGTLSLTFDLVGVSEIYETVGDWVKFNSRLLDERERALARSVFGDALDFRRIRIDERAFAGPRQGGFCYVSFNHINCWGKLSDPVLIHELVHVWQYQHLGAAYIPMALKAQRSAEGYNYGGLPALEQVRQKKGGLLDFNLEQQADIVEDYFRLHHGLPVQWGSALPSDLPVYDYFIAEIRAPF